MGRYSGYQIRFGRILLCKYSKMYSGMETEGREISGEDKAFKK